ncbi:autotransporter outer membrane beta-barrel domain-containing protein [Oleidesulfovibrio sp.]|uniref:autotransporter outer membrane beta-barrel domain-containing protein n=1 Tax=Oleidesulfovibrio sp. TaxID=2909707 RepID=UPI003A883B54
MTAIGGANAASDFDGKITAGLITFRDTAYLNLEDDMSDDTELKFTVELNEEVDGATPQTSGVLSQALTATKDDAEARATLLGLAASEANDAGLEMLVDSSGGAAATQAIAGNMITGFDLVYSRLGNIRIGRGISSGDLTSSGKSVWIRGFGTTSDQDLRDGVQGYNADTAGIMLGGDLLLDSDVRIGMNASYAHTDVNVDGPGDHETGINTYRVGVYGGKDFGQYYVEGQASVAYNDIKISRRTTFGGLDRKANGDTDGMEYGLRIGAGIPFAVDEVHTITPYTNFQYIHADVDSFTETGSGALNMRTEATGLDIAELAVGARYNADIVISGGTLKPEVRASVAYDFIGDTSESTQTFTGGGSTFTTKGADVEQFSVQYGAGLAWETADESWMLSADYDGKAKSDFTSHGARIQVIYRF